MKKVLRFIIPLAAFTLLTGCSNGKAQPINFDPSHLDIDTEWEEYNVPVESLSFSDSEKKLELEIGAKHTYSFTCSPKYATPTKLNFASSDETIAKVSYENGDYIVSALDTGHADIVVTGGERDTFNSVNLSVDVKRSIQNFSIAKTSYDIDIIDVNDENAIVVAFEPENTTQTNLTYDVIPQNEDGEAIVTVEDGVIKPNGHKGTNLIKVSSKYLPEKEPVTLTVTVSDHYKYLSDFEITADKTEVELGKTAQFTVSKLLPAEHSASEDSIQYVSSDESVLSIDDKGEATALKEGTSKVKATILQRGGVKESNEIAITVYEVKMTELSLGEDSKQTRNLTNTDPDKLTYQLNYSYKVDRSGATDPTFKEIKYSSDHPEVVSVSEEGLVTLVGPGDAKVTVKDTYSDLETTEDYCEFHVTVECTGITLGASRISAFSDEKVVLTAVTTPANLTDNNIVWDYDDEKLNVEAEGKTLTINKALEEGEYTFKASNGGFESNEVTIKFTDRPGEFVLGKYYIVGNSNFRTGKSVADKGESWQDSNRAFEFNENYGPDEPGDYDYKVVNIGALVTFNANDEFKVRNGDTFYQNIIWEQNEQGEYVRKNHYEIATDGVTVRDGDQEGDAYGNFKVVKGGTYQVVFKVYASGWYETYIALKEFTFDETASVLVGKTKTLYAINWPGSTLEVKITDASPSGCLVLNSDDHTGGKVEIRGVAEGTAKVVVTSNGVSKVCNVTVSAKPVEFEYGTYYLVGNKDYSSGTSATGASWDAPTKSLMIDEEVALPKEGEAGYDKALDYQVKATVVFEEGDQFKVRFGPNKETDYVETYVDAEHVHYEHDPSDASKIEGGKVTIDTSKVNDHFVVTHAGVYEILVKVYDKDRDNQWIALYIHNKELSVSTDYLPLVIEEETTIKASNWNGTLNVVSSDSSIVIATKDTEKNDGTINVTAVAKGDATITISDDRDIKVVSVKVSKPFKAGYAYIVGDKDYSSGTSADTGASWDDVDKALEMGKVVKPETGVSEVSATVTFTAGDKFRVRLNNYEHAFVEEKGAIVCGQMTIIDSNIVVNTAGTYTIYFKTGADGGHSIYISMASGTKLLSVFVEESVSVNGAWVAVWGWNSSKTIEHLYAGNHVGDWYYFAIPDSLVGCKFIRMISGVSYDDISHDKYPEKDKQYWNDGDSDIDITSDLSFGVWLGDGFVHSYKK